MVTFTTRRTTHYSSNIFVTTDENLIRRTEFYVSNMQWSEIDCDYPSGIHSFSFMLGSTEVPNLLFVNRFAYFHRVDPLHSRSSGPPWRSSHLRFSLSRGLRQILRYGPLLCYVACGHPPPHFTLARHTIADTALLRAPMLFQRGFSAKALVLVQQSIQRTVLMQTKPFIRCYRDSGICLRPQIISNHKALVQSYQELLTDYTNSLKHSMTKMHHVNDYQCG